MASKEIQRQTNSETCSFCTVIFQSRNVTYFPHISYQNEKKVSLSIKRHRSFQHLIVFFIFRYTSTIIFVYDVIVFFLNNVFHLSCNIIYLLIIIFNN